MYMLEITTRNGETKSTYAGNEETVIADLILATWDVILSLAERGENSANMLSLAFVSGFTFAGKVFNYFDEKGDE